MASLFGAITALTLAGTTGLPSQPYVDLRDTGGGRPNSGQFTALQTYGTPGKVQNAFGDKAVETNTSKFVSDTYIAVVTFGPVDAVDIEVSDRYVPVLGMSAFAGLTRTALDTYVPKLTFAVTGLSKSGTTAKTASDTYIPVLTFTPSLVVSKTIADSYIPVLGMTATVDTSAALDVTDSYVVALGMSYTLDSFAGTVNWPRSDTYVVRLSMSATANPSQDVDSILITEHPYWIIRIEEA